jgi:hypothetical protein
MSGLTRRRALLAVTSGVATLAGCASNDDHPTVERRRNRPIEDYDVRHVRNEDGAVLFTRRDELPTVTDDERGRLARSSRSVVVSEEGVRELTFGNAPEAEQLRSFATATDFDSSSLYLLAMSVDACYEIRLQSMTVERGELETDDLHPHTHFCRTVRPADVDCGAGETHTAGFAIRLPVAAKRSSGSGSGMSGSCGPSPRGEYYEGSVTPADGGEDE